MKKTVWDKRIPTLLGVLLIAIGIGFTSLLVKQGIVYIGKAGPTNTPQNVRITNITNDSFTVSFQTNDKVIGTVNYGEKETLGQIARDDRDQKSGTLSSYNLHNITLRRLKPTTKYFFSITSGKDTFFNNEKLFEVTTGQTIEVSPGQQEPISGKVVLSDGSQPSEAIVYATINGAQTISTLVDNDQYLLPLNSLRNQDLNSYFTFSENIVDLLIVSGDSTTSRAKLYLSQIAPVPIITLSKNYDFSESYEPLASSSADLEEVPSFGAGPASSSESPEEPKISSPSENQSLTDSQPLFRGTALPNETIKIIIRSDEIIDTVETDSYGNWSYRPETELATGEHTVTIEARNSSGILKVLTTTFTVYASGSQITESATPSATPTFTVTPTLTPVVLSPTPTPSVIIIPTQTPTPIATSSPTPTPLVFTTPTPTLAPSGNSTVEIGIMGMAVAFIGAFLFFLTRVKILPL